MESAMGSTAANFGHCSPLPEGERNEDVPRKAHPAYADHRDDKLATFECSVDNCCRRSLGLELHPWSHERKRRLSRLAARATRPVETTERLAATG